MASPRLEPTVRLLTTFILLAIPSACLADAVSDARAAHAKELARLKAELLAAIDNRIRANQRAGRSNDYLLQERKAFADNGVTPLLPEMQPAVKVYLDGKAKADEKLAGIVGPAEKPNSPEAGMPQTADALARYLWGTTWAWGPDGDLVFGQDGLIKHAGWDASGFVTRWQAVDRRTVVLIVTKGRTTDRIAVLTFGEDLGGFRGLDFGCAPLTQTRARKK